MQAEAGRKHVLVASLGRSPGVVSGATMALRARGIPISQVITVGTSSKEVLVSEQVLREFFDHVPDIALQCEHIDSNDLDDAATESYMIEVGQALESANANNEVTHVLVTGGRKGMSALAALAVNLYGADHLWHFWVSDRIAKNCDVMQIPRPALLDDVCLDPTRHDDAEWDLVPLPFLDLRGYRPLIQQYLEEHRLTGEVPAEVSPIIRLFDSIGVERLSDIFPAQMPVNFVDWLIETAAVYEDLPDEEQRVRERELARLLERHKIIDPNTEDELVVLLRRGASWSRVERVLQRDSDRRGVWQWARENAPVFTAGAHVMRALIEAVRLYYERGGGG